MADIVASEGTGSLREGNCIIYAGAQLAKHLVQEAGNPSDQAAEKDED